MTDKKSNSNRRKLLKSIAAGSGAIVAGKSLPENWAKPIVDSVVLPAHADTSPKPPLSCNAGSITIESGGFPSDAGLVYDGNASCSLQGVESGSPGSTGSDNEICIFDGDPDDVTPNADVNGGGGANWQAISINDLLAGTHTFDVKRTAGPNSGVTFRVKFTLSFAKPFTTISNVSIVALA